MEGGTSAGRYSAGAIGLHWLIAAALLFEVGLGWRTEGPPGAERFAIFQLHKSVGITILLLTLIRIGWRIAHPSPPLPLAFSFWVRMLARLTHAGFYLLLIGLPLTGWLMVSTSRIVVPTILYGMLPLPHLPVTGLDAAGKAALHGLAETGHGAFAYALYLLFALHVAGALKHHFVDRRDDMRRMLPIRSTRLSAGIMLVLILGGGALLAGNRLRLTSSPAAPPLAEPASRPAPAALTQPTVPAEAATVPPTPAEAIQNTIAGKESDEAQSPSEWSIVAQDSTLGFQTRWGSATVEGRFARWQADIRFDPDALDQSSVKVEIDMASATTNSADTQSALSGEEWFAAARYPTATFTARSFRKRGADRYEAQGELRLRDTARPLTLPFTLKISGDRAHMTGKAQIDRLRFGVGQGQWSSTTEVPAEVGVQVQLVATRK